MKTHKHTLTVYYEDTDAGGVVYHSTYLNFAERARTECLKSLGFSNTYFIENNGIYFALKHVSIDYIKPAKLEETLTITTAVADVKNASIVFHQTISRDQEILTQITSQICFITKAGKPTRIPAKFTDKLKEL
jgi:acyl-CoA thioester hydrolase